MEEITIVIPERLAEQIREMSTEWNTSVEQVVNRLLRSGFEAAKQHRIIDDSRAQRPGAENDPRLDWWRDAKFGLFIHWGLHAIPAGIWKEQDVPGIGEWIMQRAEIPVVEYERLAAQFNPVQYDADAWVRMAKQAGMKYIVITSKHHDGFCLFHSDVTDYSLPDGTPFGRDAIKELADACRVHDMPLGFYYSQTQDWHHPDGDGNEWDFNPDTKDFDDYIENYVKPQVRELLTNYGPIAIIWFDTPKSISQEQSKSLLELVHEIQPNCLVSGRLGNGLGDYASAGDNLIPGELTAQDWETPATMNDTWGYKVNDHNWKSTGEMVRKLVDIVSKGGNYLLNVGPTALGTIPKPSLERLTDIGEWMTGNSESIYEARPGPIQGRADIRTTQKDNAIYIHVFKQPTNGRLMLEGLAAKDALILVDGASVSFKNEANGCLLNLPREMMESELPVVIKLIAA